MPQKILLIEDDVFLSDIYMTKFQEVGYVIEAADSGTQGLQKAKEGTPDVILLDIVLPKMNGLEVLEKLKADADTKSIPVIILSNLGSEDDVKVGMKKGASSYIIKSQFTPSEVVECVEKTLKKEGIHSRG